MLSKEYKSVDLSSVCSFTRIQSLFPTTAADHCFGQMAVPNSYSTNISRLSSLLTPNRLLVLLMILLLKRGPAEEIYSNLQMLVTLGEVFSGKDMSEPWLFGLICGDTVSTPGHLWPQ